MWFVNAIFNISIPIARGIIGFFILLWIVLLDLLYTLANLILPRKRQIPAVWNEYIPPMSTDSRSPCPALNALCNHGVLPRDGKNVTLRDIAVAVNSHYNLSITTCELAVVLLAQELQKGLDDKIEMSSIATHNCGEHDASLVRRDTYFQPDQSTPDKELIQEFFSSLKDGKRVTRADCRHALTARLTNSAHTNPQFSLLSTHVLIAAITAAHLIDTFGGDVSVLEPFLLDERIPEGWMPVTRDRLGLTFTRHGLDAIIIYLGINPSWRAVKFQG
ncbi:hypothetical protein Clacol_007134 [Clathrus columnatus]|uniref:Heme haloperoxidase family profile domain-containing protein n=1 Tax=Clathrus columnatus TaxID=1419009 RepID=A0AAV5AHB7_9AGAM|nr:hypothetical protein Clacol_007134 [Clathrus columnatus]